MPEFTERPIFPCNHAVFLGVARTGGTEGDRFSAGVYRVYGPYRAAEGMPLGARRTPVPTFVNLLAIRPAAARRRAQTPQSAWIWGARRLLDVVDHYWQLSHCSSSIGSTGTA